MLRKLLWTAFATALTSVATGLAFHLARYVWETLAHEPPPDSALARLLVRRPMRNRILGLLQAPR